MAVSVVVLFFLYLRKKYAQHGQDDWYVGDNDSGRCLAVIEEEPFGVERVGEGPSLTRSRPEYHQTAKAEGAAYGQFVPQPHLRTANSGSMTQSMAMSEEVLRTALNMK